MNISRGLTENEGIAMDLIVSGSHLTFTLESIYTLASVKVINENGSDSCLHVSNSGYKATVSVLMSHGCNLHRKLFTRCGGTLLNSVCNAVNAAVDCLESIIEDKEKDYD